MLFILLVMLTLGVFSFVIVGTVIGIRRGQQGGYPPATDGGSPTVYRRRTAKPAD
jgi:hypothetical protein